MVRFQAERLFQVLAGLLVILMTVVARTAAADVISELRLHSDSFLSPAYESSVSQSSFQYIGASFRTDASKKDAFEVDLQGAYAVGEPLLSYINLREFSYRVPIGDRQSFIIGRKLERWSELDRRWSFGLIEPVFEWNPLSPESQGLSGLFWEVREPGYRLLLFGSFFFIPDQGPSFAIDGNGSFERGNPWFRRPPESIRIMSEVSQIQYVFEKPAETEIVFQTSYGLKLDLGEDGPWRARFALLYKPMNQLALGYDGTLSIPKDRGVIDLQPKVAYHGVRSADVAYMGRAAAAGLSVVQDLPSNDEIFEDQWTAPEFSQATLISPWLDVSLARGWRATLQYLDVSGGEVTENGPLADPNRAPITSRFPYKQAAQVSLQAEQRLFRSRRLLMTTSYTHSEKNEFRLFRWQGRLELSSLWSLHSELQLVDAEEMTKENRNDIAEYANNDRIVMGIGYVF